MGIFWSSATDEKEDEELQSERTKVAIHEAGHAIACDALGIAYTEIHVSVSRTYWTGQLQSSGYVWTPSGTYHESDLAAMALAGMAAEAFYYMEELGWRKRKAWDEAESHASIDISHAREYVGRSGIYTAERTARRLIESRWLAVKRLAAKL